MRIAKYYRHPYEEPCISFRNGSGAVFFTGCSLRCVFCQNYELSRAQRGKPVTPRELADIFRFLEEDGAENINLVTATHFADEVIEALTIYRPDIPVVYNTHGYERMETLEALDPYIDIYLPDLKFYSPEISERYTGRADYFEYASEAVRYMARKPLLMRGDGKMLSGCIVRHLIMPLCTDDSLRLVRWIAGNLPRETFLSLMRQYTPCGEAGKYPELRRTITAREYRKVLACVRECGLENVFLQDASAAGKEFIPEWDY